MSQFFGSQGSKTGNNSQKSNFLGAKKAIIGTLMLFSYGMTAIPLQAGFFGVFSDLLAAGDKTERHENQNVQSMPLLRSTGGMSTNYALAGDISIVGGMAVEAQSGPLGSISDVQDEPSSHRVAIYTVRKGDTIGQVARMYDVSVNTILWANDLKSSVLSEGQIIIILPVSGVMHIVKEKDTLKSIAKKYKADVEDIKRFNGILTDSELEVGSAITVPDGDISSPKTVGKSTSSKGTSRLIAGFDGPDLGRTFLRPVDGLKTQGLHGYNGVDLGAPIGTPVIAAAAGRVVLARSGGYNAGYGSYVVIEHDGGVQTLYAHLSKVSVETGDLVYRSQKVGNVGSTGRSTGPHLHFEVRGARNPFQ